MLRPKLRSRAQRGFAPRLEALESRYAPSCSWNSATNVLTGGAGGDAVEIRTQLTSMWIYCDGSLMAFGADTDGGMTFNAGVGSYLTLTNPDSYIGSYTVNNSSLVTTLHNYTANFNSNVLIVFLQPGIGNDAITWKPGHLSTSPDLYVSAGAGTDTLVVDDLGYSGGDVWQITDQIVTNYNGVSYANFADVENVVFQAGPGDDNVTIGGYFNNYTLDNLPKITVDGGTGVDTVVGDDSGRIGGDTYQLDQYGLSTGSKGYVFYYYQNIENVTLKTGAGNDSITASSVSPGGFLFTSPRVTVNTGGGIDTLTANDSNDGGGKPYKVTDVDVCKLNGSFTACVGYDSNLENLTLKTGYGNDTFEVSGSGNKLFDKPLVYVDPGAGSNTLTVDDSGNPTDEVYKITESDVSLPNTFGQTVIYPVGKIHTLELKAGAGSDSITVSNSAGTLGGFPYVTVTGGVGATNSLTVSDAAYIGGDTYTVTSNQVSLPNTLGPIVTYSDIYYVWLEVGSGNDTVNLGNDDGTLTGMPFCYVVDLAASDSDVINVRAQNDPGGATYAIAPATHGGYVIAENFVTSFWFTEQLNVYTGMGDDTIDIAKVSGQLIDMGVGVFGGGGTNTLSIYDQKNPTAATYVATSFGTPGLGTLAVTNGFAGSFESINVVNLHRSLKPGTVVDKSGYDPADYVLNIIPVKQVFVTPHVVDPIIGDPMPMPAPPIRSREQAIPALEAPRLEHAPGRHMARPIAADLVFADPLGELVLAFKLIR